MHAVGAEDRTREAAAPDLGDLVIVLLAGTLSGLRERLFADGFRQASELVEDLVEVVDTYLHHLPRDPQRDGG